VTDDGSPNLSATNSFEVLVTEVNSPPVLQAIPDRMIHAGGALWVACVAQDSSGESNLLSFSLDGSPPAGLSIEPTNGIVTWATADADANTTNAVVVRVTDDGAPPLSDTKSFTVTVVARPMIQTIVVSNDVTTVTWSAIAGQGYWLQGVPDIGDTNWVDVAGEVTASGPSASQNDAAIGQRRYYRVRLSP
jgi:hypothetical protein